MQRPDECHRTEIQLGRRTCVTLLTLGRTGPAGRENLIRRRTRAASACHPGHLITSVARPMFGQKWTPAHLRIAAPHRLPSYLTIDQTPAAALSCTQPITAREATIP